MGNPGVQMIYRVVLPEPYEVSTESIVSADDHGTCDPLSSCNGKGEGLVRFGIDRLRTRAVLLLHPAYLLDPCVGADRSAAHRFRLAEHGVGYARLVVRGISGLWLFLTRGLLGLDRCSGRTLPAVRLVQQAEEQ